MRTYDDELPKRLRQKLLRLTDIYTVEEIVLLSGVRSRHVIDRFINETAIPRVPDFLKLCRFVLPSRRKHRPDDYLARISVPNTRRSKQGSTEEDIRDIKQYATGPARGAHR